MFLKLRFNHNYPEFNSIPFSKDSESGKGEHVDLDRFPMRIYFFCLRKKTSVIIWSVAKSTDLQEITLSTVMKKSINKHVEWGTETEWREPDHTAWGLVSCLVSLNGDMNHRKESASKSDGNELHLITNVSCSMILSEATSSPTQYTCNQRQVLWLWTSLL